MLRTTAREIALVLIYEMEFSDMTAEELLDGFFSESYYPTLSGEATTFQAIPPDDQMEYIRDCVTGVSSHIDELDHIIETYAVGWKISRIAKVTLSVLRLAVYEILYINDAPTNTVINEAVEIARRYEEEEKVSFINGILGSFARSRNEDAGV